MGIYEIACLLFLVCQLFLIVELVAIVLDIEWLVKSSLIAVCTTGGTVLVLCLVGGFMEILGG